MSVDSSSKTMLILLLAYLICGLCCFFSYTGMVSYPAVERFVDKVTREGDGLFTLLFAVGLIVVLWPFLDCFEQKIDYRMNYCSK